MDSKPELQRVLEHRRRNQIIKKKKEELEAKRLQCPFEQELLRRQQRLSQVSEDTSPPALARRPPRMPAGPRKSPVCGRSWPVEPNEGWTAGPPLA